MGKIILIGHSHLANLLEYRRNYVVGSGDEDWSDVAAFEAFAVGGLRLDHLTGPVRQDWHPSKQTIPDDFHRFLNDHASPGDSVVFFLGDNDLNIDNDTFAPKYLAFVTLIRKKFHLRSAVVCPLLPHHVGARGDILAYNFRARKVNEFIKSSCASYEKLFYNGSASFPFPGSDRNGKSQAYVASAQSFQRDGVHLTIYGQSKLFRSILNVFKKEVK